MKRTELVKVVEKTLETMPLRDNAKYKIHEDKNYVIVDVYTESKGASGLMERSLPQTFKVHTNYTEGWVILNVLCLTPKHALIPKEEN